MEPLEFSRKKAKYKLSINQFENILLLLQQEILELNLQKTREKAPNILK